MKYSLLLLLMLCLGGAFAQTDSLKRERKVTFGISAVPVFYYDVKTISRSTARAAPDPIHPPQTASVGVHLLLGPAIKKRFYPAVGTGIEGWSDKLRVPLYFDFGMKVLKARYSPYWHTSVGCIYRLKRDGEGEPNGISSIFVGLGLGFSAAVANHFAVTLCADYRMMRYDTKGTGYSPGGVYEAGVRNFVHQAGVRLLLTYH
jgi:hypothetical protein